MDPIIGGEILPRGDLRQQILRRGWRMVLAAALVLRGLFIAGALAVPGPLDEMTLARPVADEVLASIAGDTPSYAFAHGRGVVKASPAALLAALRDPALLVDRRRVSVFRVLSEGAERMLVRNEVHTVITVDFDTEWHTTILEGTPEAPVRVVIRGEKVAGTKYIDRLEDSILLTKLDDGRTEVQIVRHVHAFHTGQDEARSFVNDVFASLVARAHGRPLPEFR